MAPAIKFNCFPFYDLCQYIACIEPKPTPQDFKCVFFVTIYLDLLVSYIGKTNTAVCTVLFIRSCALGLRKSQTLSFLTGMFRMSSMLCYLSVCLLKVTCTIEPGCHI